MSAPTKEMRSIPRFVVRLLGFFVMPHRDHTGRYHWLLQRITAIALLPLYAWLLVFAFPEASVADYDELRHWMRAPVNATLIVVTIVLSLRHMVLGLESIVEDYIATPSLNRIALFSVRWGAFLVTLVTLAAVFNVFWQP